MPKKKYKVITRDFSKTFRMNEQEIRLFEETAKREGISEGALIRRKVFGYGSQSTQTNQNAQTTQPIESNKIESNRV